MLTDVLTSVLITLSSIAPCETITAPPFATRAAVVDSLGARGVVMAEIDSLSISVTSIDGTDFYVFDASGRLHGIEIMRMVSDPEAALNQVRQSSGVTDAGSIDDSWQCGGVITLLMARTEGPKLYVTIIYERTAGMRDEARRH